MIHPNLTWFQNLQGQVIPVSRSRRTWGQDAGCFSVLETTARRGLMISMHTDIWTLLAFIVFPLCWTVCTAQRGECEILFIDLCIIHKLLWEACERHVSGLMQDRPNRRLNCVSTWTVLICDSFCFALPWTWQYATYGSWSPWRIRCRDFECVICAP